MRSGDASGWLQQIHALRNTVALMGEQATPPLWRSQGTTPDGAAYLSDLFPRSSQRAALAMAVKAAQREYDRRLGTIGRFHLFRLPSEHEEALISLAHNDNQALAGQLASYDDGLEHLKRLAGAAPGQPLAPGPRNAGIFSPATGFVRDLASLYVAAFTQGVDVVPYFSGQDR